MFILSYFIEMELLLGYRSVYQNSKKLIWFGFIEENGWSSWPSSEKKLNKFVTELIRSQNQFWRNYFILYGFSHMQTLSWRLKHKIMDDLISCTLFYVLRVPKFWFKQILEKLVFVFNIFVSFCTQTHFFFDMWKL